MDFKELHVHYLKAEPWSRKSPVRAEMMLKEQPDIQILGDIVEGKRRELKWLTSSKEQFEERHPIKSKFAKLGFGEGSSKYAVASRVRNSLESKKVELSRMFSDPKRQEEARKSALEFNQAVENAQLVMREIKPHYERAEKAINERHRGREM